MRRTDFVSRVLMTVLLLTVACSTDSTQQGAQLSLVIGNTDVRSVQYNIVCEGGATFTDEFEVVDDRDPPVWETFVGLPAGEDCVITLTAFNEAGNPICTGSTTVTILEGQTVKADVTMQCPTTGEIGTGNVNIDGRFEDVIVDVCPIIHILNAIPRVMTELPGESSLRVQSTDPDTGAEAATVLSSSSGVIDDPDAKNTGFTCTQGGLVEVTATAAAGDPNCEQRVTITLTCPDTGNACDGVDCDDGNECTDDGCADGVCSNVDAPDGTTCSIGECVDGQCQPIVDPCEGVSCDDQNECTTDVCTDGNCSNPPVADDTPCDGGTCQGGACEPSDLCANDPCNDGDVCTLDLCDPTDGSCANPTAPDGTACGVDLVCTAGICGPVVDPCEGVSCDDQNECTTDVCTDGNCSNPPVADDTPCTGGTCQAGVCEPSSGLCDDAATRCDDLNDCTADSCDDSTGECSNDNLPDLTLCNDDQGICVTVGGSSVCLTAPACPGDPLCNDDNPCTIDICDEEAGTCSYDFEPSGTSCGIGGTCDGLGTCSGGIGG